MGDSPAPGLDDGHRKFLRRTATYLLSGMPASGLDASDAVQKAMMRAYEKGHQYAGASHGEYRRWLRQILYHVLIDEARRIARGPDAPALDESVRRLEELLVAEDTPPQAGAARAEGNARLREAIGALPGDQREAVELRVLGG